MGDICLTKDQVLKAMKALSNNKPDRINFDSDSDYEEAMRDHKRKFGILDKLLFTGNIEED